MHEWHICILSSSAPQLMASNDLQMLPVPCLQEIQYVEEAQCSAWLTIIVIYHGLCSLFYSTNLLKDGCLACIGPPHDKDTKMWAQVSFPEHFNMCPIICAWCSSRIMWMPRHHIGSLNGSPPVAVSDAITSNEMLMIEWYKDWCWTQEKRMCVWERKSEYWSENWVCGKARISCSKAMNYCHQ